MCKSALLCLTLACCACSPMMKNGAESQSDQRMSHMTQEIRRVSRELEWLHEQVLAQQNQLEVLETGSGSGGSGLDRKLPSLEKRILGLEQVLDAMSQDLQLMQTVSTETSQALSRIRQDTISHLEKRVEDLSRVRSDVQQLVQAIEGGGGSAASETAQVIQVKSGDTLERIARRHGTTVETVRRMNALKSDLIQVGQKLRIPAKK